VDVVRPRLERWGLAIIWASLPVTAGPAFDAALSDRSAVFATTVSLGLWTVWVVTLLALLVPRVSTLTAVRLVVPASLVAAAWAAVVTAEPSWRDAVALAVTALATVVVLASATGDRFVNGSSYGTERRFALRPPGPLLLGPLELAWVASVAGAVAAPLLLAAGIPLAALAAALVGWPVAWAGARSLHRLAQRWVVFVPAGVVLADPLVLGDTLLMQRRNIERLGLAPTDPVAADLTGGALGVAIEVRFASPQLVTVARAGRREERPQASAVPVVLFAPSRPGAVLTEADDRRLPVG
jgi:hypothetical protein